MLRLQTIHILYIDEPKAGPDPIKSIILVGVRLISSVGPGRGGEGRVGEATALAHCTEQHGERVANWDRTRLLRFDPDLALDSAPNIIPSPQVWQISKQPG